MQSAIYTNNRAATLIENDCFERALDLLSETLTSVQQQQQQQDESSDESGAMQECNKHYLSTSNKTRKNLDFMYSRPVYVDQTPEVQGHRFLSLVLLFNSALCHHLQALNNNYNGAQDKDENLIQALRLYEAAIAMQRENNLPKDATYFMAMNNLAHIYQILHRPRQAQQFLNKMLSSLVNMMDNGQDEALDQFDNFLDNASRTILPSIDAAMAA